MEKRGGRGRGQKLNSEAQKFKGSENDTIPPKESPRGEGGREGVGKKTEAIKKVEREGERGGEGEREGEREGGERGREGRGGGERGRGEREGGEGRGGIAIHPIHTILNAGVRKNFNIMTDADTCTQRARERMKSLIFMRARDATTPHRLHRVHQSVYTHRKGHCHHWKTGQRVINTHPPQYIILIT